MNFSEHLEIARSLPPYLVQCVVCGNEKPSIEFSEQTDRCDQCVNEGRETKFQEALNEMPAGFVLTFNLMVSNYYQKLADKNSAGENILLLKKFAQEGMKYKHEKIHE